MPKTVYIGIIVTITSICFIGYFLSSNNNQELQVDQEIIHVSQNEISKEENNYPQEETEIINNNLIFLDNQYLNIIIFFIFYLFIACLFFYSLNPIDMIKCASYEKNDKCQLKKNTYFF